MQRALAVSSVLLVLGVAAILWKLDRLEIRLDPTVKPGRVALDVGEMQSFTTSWESVCGSMSITTQCREDESLEACWQRHRDAVERAQKDCPPL